MILQSLHKSLNQYIPPPQVDDLVLVEASRLWIGHLLGDHSSDHMLTNIILSPTFEDDVLIKGWIHRVIHHPLDLYCLLNRHYLVAYLTNKEIHTVKNNSSLWILMASMMTMTNVFAPIPDPSLWQGIDTDPHPVNSLRQNRPLIHHYARTLAMRDDVTDHQLQRDHAHLSSLSLVYGLYLIRVILIHEVTIRPQKDLSLLLESIALALTHLKGVFNNVESHWLSPHV